MASAMTWNISVVEIRKNSGSLRAPGAGFKKAPSRSVSLVKGPSKKPTFVKPLLGMGVTVPSMRPLNFSQEEKGSLI